jgi:hypothetical protein
VHLSHLRSRSLPLEPEEPGRGGDQRGDSNQVGAFFPGISGSSVAWRQDIGETENSKNATWLSSSALIQWHSSSVFANLSNEGATLTGKRESLKIIIKAGG